MQPKHIVAPDGSYEEWRLRHKLHRVAGPAFIGYENGNVTIEQWCLNDKRHRENGPARIKYRDGGVIEEEWWIDNKLHRENGPAYIKYQDGKIIYKEWWVEGILLSKEDFSLEMIVKMRAYSLFSPVEIARMRKYAT